MGIRLPCLLTDSHTHTPPQWTSSLLICTRALGIHSTERGNVQLNIASVIVLSWACSSHTQKAGLWRGDKGSSPHSRGPESYPVLWSLNFLLQKPGAE